MLSNTTRATEAERAQFLKDEAEYDAIETVTEQRELTAAREECARWRQSFDGHVYLKNEEYAELCEIKRQRDRLAEALESIVGESAYEGLPESKQQAIEQALQSLTN